MYIALRKKILGRFYIGQKKILKVEKKKPLKGHTRKRKVIKETDWKKYCSSSNELKRLISSRGKEFFIFEILEFCDCKWMMNYKELEQQINNRVMFTKKSFNGILNVRIAKFSKFCTDDDEK